MGKKYRVKATYKNNPVYTNYVEGVLDEEEADEMVKKMNTIDISHTYTKEEVKNTNTLKEET